MSFSFTLPQIICHRKPSLSQHVQGFDYAKKHMGHQQGEETISVTKETLVLGLPVRDAPLSLDRKVHQDGAASKRPPSADIIHKG